MHQDGKITLVRELRSRCSVAGTIYTGGLGVQGDPICRTLELPWRDNATNVSCIPCTDTGYTLTRRHSPLAKRSWDIDEVWDISVPGRSYVMFHPGNYHRDTHGCVLTGDSIALRGGNMSSSEVTPPDVWVIDSVKAYQALAEYLDTRDAWTLYVTDRV